jgi:hypothetical protein
MIVDEFDVVRAGIGPLEADPELVVDPDGMLSLAVSCEGFQHVSWW